MTPRTGYSILEVLIAFAVMSMTLAVLLPGQTELLGRAGTAAEQALAHDLAVSRIEAVKLLGPGAPSESYGNWEIEQTLINAPGQQTVTVLVKAATGRTLANVTRKLGVRDAE